MIIFNLIHRSPGIIVNPLAQGLPFYDSFMFGISSSFQSLDIIKIPMSDQILACAEYEDCNRNSPPTAYNWQVDQSHLRRHYPLQVSAYQVYHPCTLAQVSNHPGRRGYNKRCRCRHYTPATWRQRALCPAPPPTLRLPTYWSYVSK